MFYSSINKPSSKTKRPILRSFVKPEAPTKPVSVSRKLVKVIRYSEHDCPSCETTKKAWKKFQTDNPTFDCVDCIEGDCEIPDEIEGYPQIAIEVGDRRKLLLAGWDKSEILEEVEKLQRD